jgi:hypothetical protein
MEADKLRDGIFALHTRRFGKVAEIMVKKLTGYKWAPRNSYDLRDPHTMDRVEVKFFRARRAHEAPIDESNVVEAIMEATASSGERPIDFADRCNTPFRGAVEQVKLAEFDVLYYGVFFADKIMICRIEADQIPNVPYHSCKQHKGHREGGQFIIDQGNVRQHQDDFLYKLIDYNDLWKLLSK